MPIRFKMKKATIYKILVLALIISLSGCRSNTTPGENSQSVDDTDSTNVLSELTENDSLETADDSDTSERIEIMLLPSPDEILNEILGGNFNYNNSLVNSLKNENKYLSVKAQALNLGIYLTDLAYINLNNDKTGAFQYFRVIREISQKLNIYQPFYGDLFNRVQKNIANQDSMNSIFKEIYYQMLETLEASRQNDIYAFIVTGALIESLYIPTVSIEKTNEYEVVATKIFEQKFIINNFYDHLSQYKKEKYIRDVMMILGDIRDILNKAATKSTEKVVIQKDKGNFTISGGDDIVVTEQMFKTISERIKEIRSEIVNSN